MDFEERLQHALPERRRCSYELARNRREMLREDDVSHVWQQRTTPMEQRIVRRICRLAGSWQRGVDRDVRESRRRAASASRAARDQQLRHREATPARWRQTSRPGITMQDILRLRRGTDTNL
mmetsp:Transcript_160721/g.511321  ORF Transcript_160721/g.511321 Transcript_160721/m.511321 type:complete len:122 (-) Transcript_160721:184-549(-)